MIVAARSSPLSRAQVKEALWGLEYQVIWLETRGDKDKTTSLRTMDKTDFFTREVDAVVISGEADIAVHSAKDLPEPLSDLLEIVELTACIDPRDSLVFRENISHISTPHIATSSVRREEAVRALFPGAVFSDLRGTIHERLFLLEQRKIDGIVVAEAALIRLGLTHLPRHFLPGPTVPMQGSLAIVARKDNLSIKKFFQCRIKSST